MSPVSADDADRIRKRGKPRPKGSLPFLPDGDDVEALRDWLTLAYHPVQRFRFDTFDRANHNRAAPCTITFRNGRETKKFRFDQQADLIGPKLRPNVLGISEGWLRMGNLTPSEISDVWAALCMVGRVLSQYEETEETVKWMEQLIDSTSPLRGFSLTPDTRHDALMAIRHNGEFVQADALQMVRGTSNDWQRRPLRFIDKETEEQWVRAGEAAAFIRWVVGAERLTHAVLRARLAEIGIERVYFEARQAPHPKVRLYRLTPELVEYLEEEPEAEPSGEKKATTGAQDSFAAFNDKGERMAF